ncbi:GNAT family N-acetyltransferase [Jiangella alkaliphila]|uniref:Ribosomal protein S18 acetylase RimI n=1 Tax=Jiangella alkaliphila TaxID=419479 RepID=A0A1H2L4G9_9ACTN|nr:GNAT family N-acetyltransferase [Jiangella alkaliphila]SDU75714.1 Ribosomal protein S18 acetylase RimI [Jiangella alkaliphila]
MEIRATDPESDLARRCLSAFADELRVRFPEGFDDGDLVAARELVPPGGVLLVATADRGTGLACGAVRTIAPATGELRHMWVHPDARGQGLGRRLLGELEAHATTLGLTTLKLGTHAVLTEAVQLYRSAGYAGVEPYGDTPHVHHWFAKQLTQAADAP